MTTDANPVDRQQQSLASIQPGDGSLTCAELARAIAQTDQLINSQQPTEPCVGRSVATSMGNAVLGMVPLVGGVMSAVMSTEEQQHDIEDANERANQKSMIHDRKEHLMALYEGKRCDQNTAAADARNAFSR
jgi:hypothetical protein